MQLQQNLIFDQQELSALNSAPRQANGLQHTPQKVTIPHNDQQLNFTNNGSLLSIDPALAGDGLNEIQSGGSKSYFIEAKHRPQNHHNKNNHKANKTIQVSERDMTPDGCEKLAQNQATGMSQPNQMLCRSPLFSVVCKTFTDIGGVEDVFSYCSKYINMRSFRFKGTKKIVSRRKSHIHSMLPFEFHSEESETEPENLNEEIMSLVKPLLSVVLVKGDYYVYQGKSMKHGYGLGQKCKSDSYFITDVIERLASRAFLVVADQVIEELDNKEDKSFDEDDEDKVTSHNSGVVVRAGDVVRFGRVCYLIKQTSIDVERKAVQEISKRQYMKQRERESQQHERRSTGKKPLQYFSDPHNQDNSLCLDNLIASCQGNHLQNRRETNFAQRYSIEEGASSVQKEICLKSPQKQKSPKTQSETENDKSNDHQEALARPSNEIDRKSVAQRDKCCRICFSGDDGQDSLVERNNPLISPCQCSGSGKYVHLECLREWLKSNRIVVNRFFFDNYIYKVNRCEVCSTIYPDQVIISGQKYDLFEFELPEEEPYILMEVIGMPIGKNLKVIKVKEDFTLSIGRDEESDVRINDSSVSFKHATIRFDYSISEFVLQDDFSKYGTLLLIREPIKLSSRRETSIQVGSSIITLKLERNKITSLLSKICAQCKFCFDKKQVQPSAKYLAQSSKKLGPRVLCEVCLREEREPSVYDIMNYSQRLPPEIISHFLRQHLEEDKQNKPLIDPFFDEPGLDNLHDLLERAYETSFFTQAQALQLESFLRNELQVDLDRKLRGVYLEDGYTKLEQDILRQEQILQEQELVEESLAQIEKNTLSEGGSNAYEQMGKHKIHSSRNVLQKSDKIAHQSRQLRSKSIVDIDFAKNSLYLQSKEKRKSEASDHTVPASPQTRAKLGSDCKDNPHSTSDSNLTKASTNDQSKSRQAATSELELIEEEFNTMQGQHFINDIRQDMQTIDVQPQQQLLQKD